MPLATRLALLTVLAASCLFAAAAPALATVRVSKSELNGSQLRIEGTATANRSITVDGVAMTTSTSSGSFKLQRDGFAKPSTCKVAVNDGSATATTATLSGCSVSTTPSPTPTPTPTPTPATTPTLTAVRGSPTDVPPGPPGTRTVVLSSAPPAGRLPGAAAPPKPPA